MQQKFASFKHILSPGTGCKTFNLYNTMYYIKVAFLTLKSYHGLYIDVKLQ